MANLNEKLIAALKPGAQRLQILDDETKGLLVRVEPSGKRLFGWYRKVNGVPRYRALGESPETSLADARIEADKLNAIVAEWKRTRFADPDPFAKVAPTPKATAAPSFRELLDAYVSRHVKATANNPERAETDLRWLCKKHLSAWMDRPVDSITVADVVAIKNEQAAEGHAYLANRIVASAAAIFHWCGSKNDGAINFFPLAENPCKGVSKLEVGEPRDRILSSAELIRFEAALETETDIDLRDFLTLAWKTGARKTNVLQMKWSEVSFERATWQITMSKSGSGYAVQMLPEAMDVLQRRRAVAPEDSIFVFPADSRRGYIANIDKRWIEFRDRAGIPDVRIHDLRRTNGSYLAMSGQSLEQIGAALGHVSSSATKIYARFAGQSLRESREAGEQKMREMMDAERKRQTQPQLVRRQA
jgi:integrase